MTLPIPDSIKNYELSKYPWEHNYHELRKLKSCWNCKKCENVGGYIVCHKYKCRLDDPVINFVCDGHVWKVGCR